MKKRILFAALLSFLLLEANSEIYRRIFLGTYASSLSDQTIKITKDNYCLYGDKIEIRTDESKRMIFTVLSQTSFGNVHEIYSLASFD